MELEDELRQVLRDDRLDIPIRAGAEWSLVTRVRRRRQRRAGMAAAGAVAAIMLAGGGVALLDQPSGVPYRSPAPPASNTSAAVPPQPGSLPPLSRGAPSTAEGISPPGGPPVSLTATMSMTSADVSILRTPSSSVSTATSTTETSGSTERPATTQNQQSIPTTR